MKIKSIQLLYIQDDNNSTQPDLWKVGGVFVDFSQCGQCPDHHTGVNSLYDVGNGTGKRYPGEATLTLIQFFLIISHVLGQKVLDVGL